jgi:GAF domain-containing protein
MNHPIGEFEHDRLSILRKTGLLDGDPNPILEAICDTARRRFDVAAALVSILEEDEQLIEGRSGTGLTRVPRELAFCNYTILDQRPFIVGDLKQDARFSDHPMVVEAPHLRFYAGVPLQYAGKINLGAFCILDTRPGLLAEPEIMELSKFAERAREELLKKIHASC